MGKDPAFLFYPGDWLGGTVGMTFEEKGAYMELLMAQFTRGHMTEHMIGRMVGHHWDILKDKFVQDKDGLWYNQRLEDEKEKRKNFVNSRKNNIKGENQHTKTKKNNAHMNGHMTSHMENRNEDVNDNDNYIIIGDDKVFDVKPVLEYYEAQLNQMERDMDNIAWKPLVNKWFLLHLMERFVDMNHVKNSFKKYYMMQKPPKKQLQRNIDHL